MSILNRWNRLVLPSLALTHFLVADSEKQPLSPVTTQPSRTITPAVAPSVKTVNVTTSADFIWWKTHLGNMEYAWTGVADPLNVTTGNSVGQGNIKAPDFDFAPGFKLGLGFTFNHDGWDLFARYTWLYQNSSTSTTAQDKGLAAIYPNSPTSIRSFAIVDASMNWKQEFNVLDLELGRNFFISRRLSLRPFVGLKADFIRERFHEHYSFSGSFPDDIFRQERVYGLGIRGGLNSVWHFFKNFGLYGDMSVTALWSDFHSTIFEELQFEGESGTFTQDFFNSYEKTQQVLPVLEAGIGLIFQHWFHGGRRLVFAKAGWEGQVWVDYNQIPQAPTVGKAGNLSLHGLTVEVGFTF